MDDERPAMAPLMVLDTPALYYRAFYALPSSITSESGEPVGAVRGLLDMIAHLIDTYGGVNVLACWDDDWRPAFRVELVPSYKAHRVTDGGEETPPELKAQLGWIRQALEAADIPVIGCAGYEADDVIASLVTAAGRATVVTGDRDLFQLVTGDVSVVYPGKSIRGARRIDPGVLRDEYAVESGTEYAVMATLRGDPSDGLPGVAGVGAKTAAKLVRAFGDIEGIIDAATVETPVKPMTPRIAEAVRSIADELRRAYRVVTTVKDLPVSAWINAQGEPIAGGFDRGADRADARAWAAPLRVENSLARLLSARERSSAETEETR